MPPARTALPAATPPTAPPPTATPRRATTQPLAAASERARDRQRKASAAPARVAPTAVSVQVAAFGAGTQANTAIAANAAPAATAAAAAAAASAAADPMLPTAEFSGERLAVIDADVTLDVDTLLMPSKALTLRDLRTRVLLDDARLRVDPLRFAVAGGEVVGSMQLDGQQQPNAMKMSIDLRRLDIGQLLGELDKDRQSGGRLGAQLRLTGRGASVAAILGSADGSVTVAMSGGQISHFVLAAASLNGGRILQLALGGDRPSEIRCAGAALTLEDGLGQLQPLVFDTEHVRIDGEGVLNLKKERYDITLRPQPKTPNILSVRGPVHVQGTFRSVDVSLDSRSMVRAGAAAALALVNPLAALIPLIETGSGEDARCGEVLGAVPGAAAQARSRSDAVPGAAKK
ncbi:MAG: AsmA family protein [Burkholderiaceae bacterium]|nr:AsmA family protein [Burkholderiaceae bacterium]